MKKSLSFVFLFVLSLLFSACEFGGDGTITVFPIEQNQQKTTEQNIYSDWTAVNQSQSAHLKVFEILDENGKLRDRINVLALNKSKFTFELKENITNPLTVNAWHFENENALAVINGSFFDENYKATGGLWTKGQGKIISLTGNNTYDGAVMIDENGKLSLRYLPSNNLEKLKNEEQVMVNFPMLIHKGKPLLTENTDKQAIRSLLGEDDQFVYLIKNDLGYFSLYDLMNWVSKNIDGIENLLNLDGGSSSGLSVHGDSVKWSNNSFVNVPNVIFAYEKK